jgi:hypothetical protein
MRYLGIVKQQDGNLTLPDTFREADVRRTYEAIQVGGDIILLTVPLDQERLKNIEKLATISIDEHRSTLERLAR